MSRHTILASGALAVAATLTLAACGGGAGQSGTGAGGASAWALTGGAEPAFKTAFENWNAANADEQIAVEWFANDAFKEKIRTAVNTSQSPTLVYGWAGGTLRDYVSSGVVADITEQTKGLQDRLFDSVVDAGKVDGKVYAVPNNQSQPVVLYYNQELFSEYGVEAPHTWEQFTQAISTFKDAGVIPVALAGQSQWPYLMWIQYLTDRIGGPEVFQAVMEGQADAWSDPAITEALTKIQELVDMGAFGTGYGSVVADAGGDTALVHTGRAAMVLQGSWVYSNFLNDAPAFVEAGSLGYTNFPTVSGGTGDPANLVGNTSNYWSVSAKASPEAQATAIRFLEEANLSDAYVDELLSIGAVPAVKGLEDKIAGAANPEYLGFVYQMVAQAPHFQLSWDQALPAAQGQALLTNLSQIFLKQITPKQFVTAMNATL